MPSFLYQAIDARTGRELSGWIESPNAEQAILKLKSRQLFPTELQPEPAAAPAARLRRRRWSFGPVRPRERLHFTRQLAALIRAGMPLLRALEVLMRQEANAGWREVIAALAATLRAGGSLSAGMARHPRVFDARSLSLVRAGEAGGQLDASLERLARLLEKTERLKARVRAALLYPAVIAVVAAGIVTALMVFVVPRFESVFAGLLKGQPLPGLTQAVIAAGRFGREHAVGLAAGAAAVALALAALVRTGPGRRLVDRATLGLPLLGDLALKAAMARFSRTFGALLSAGVPILQALLIARDTAGSAPVAAALATVHGRVQAGEPVAGPLAATGVFPPMMTGLVEVGEETGALPEMLLRVADVYDDEVDRAVSALTSLIEPLLIVLMAAVVGTVVIALFLPIVRIIQALG